MFYHSWEPIYKKIVEDFGFSVENDKLATKILDELLQRDKQFSIKKLEELIANKEVVAFGAGPSLENFLKNNKKKIVNKIKIAADGATTALLEHDVKPEIIVTDLDGNVSDQIKANSSGSVVIIHAHGDNIDKLRRYVPKFNGVVIGSTQVDSKPYRNVNNFGGFTDGDRAVFLADHFNAKKIYLVGFDFEGVIGKYSFSESKDKSLKLKKLKWCKYLIELLMKNRKNICYLR